MLEADISRQDIAPFCIFGDEGYRRNLVSRSDWYELLVLCWKAGQKSPVHDHCGSSCVFKIIEGAATEIRGELTSEHRNKVKLVRPSAVEVYGGGSVCASTSSDIHEIVNTNPGGSDLITLHVYSPPLHMNVYEYQNPAEASQQMEQFLGARAL
ncbi:MAG: hypothetical protein DCC75_02975 [Proteobacteria bacterium]|nr:MAG: hypothetical protein DCC75_02975 [Pseudomonadota bacterium]